MIIRYLDPWGNGGAGIIPMLFLRVLLIAIL